MGGIYDDRFLLKVTPAYERLLPDAPRATPYEGAKEMLLVEAEDRDTLHDVVEAMWEELPHRRKERRSRCPAPTSYVDEAGAGFVGYARE